MELSGDVLIPAPRAVVWAALNDPDVLKGCIPGCQSIEKESDTAFTAKVKAKIGPVSATFGGRVALSEIDPPNSYVIAGEGQGGVAGFGKGSARVSLTDEDGGTRLTYAGEAQVGGKLAQIGSRLVQGTVTKLAGQFFAAFAKACAKS
ncbi:MAG: carbon monoxide dehydrogenase subunit G [Alphaproteobacteria bacterium]|nr:carbon monoxide dehydrogenase subunit G [Alphaproteobacteria bacterium]